MSTRSQRDKEKKQQEEFQSVLRRLLLEEDNKYCADCDAKGPRWASWNIGVFLCIRCAGIHRNLGVHISKVKSVNLDTWTEKQITSIEGRGNRTCRKIYEANLPSSFRRPQTDSALEHFIRAKYEHKKYADKELEKQVQAKKDVPRSSNSSSEPEKKKKSSHDKPVTLQKLAKAPASSGTRQSPTKTQLAPINANAFQQTQRPQPAATSSAPVTPPKTQSSMDDLLGLSTPKFTDTNALFDIPISQQKNDLLLAATPQMVPSSSAPSLSSPTQQQQQQPQPVTNGVTNDVDLFGAESTKTSSGKTSKESILALFGNQPSQPHQMYNIPGGMYIPSQQQNQTQMGNNFTQPQMMMNQQQGVMGMPAGQQGMMGVNMGYGGVNPMQQQQAYLQQVQAQMQNMRVSGSMGMNGQVGMNGPMAMNGQIPQQPQQQQSAPQAWNGGMYPSMQQVPGVPVQGNMGWGGNMAGQTLSTQLWK